MKGNNLFHSFQKFTIPIESTAYFNNALDIKNIISRVTGTSISSVNGLIKANGTANLFLLNPQGVLFGPGASLNIGGSFIVSTAEGLSFADGTLFETQLSESEPLLTVSVPVGLTFGNSPGPITLVGPGHQLIAAGGLGKSGITPVANIGSIGLQVQPGKTLAVVGGDISLEGSILTAEGGRIEVGSVDQGVASLSSTPSGLTLSYKDIPSFNDILLSERSLIDVSGAGSGSIQVQGQRVRSIGGSVLLHQNRGFLPAGPISLTASESFELSGTDPVALVAGGISAETLGLGRGGDIVVNTSKLVLTEGGVIATRSFTPADSGDIFINAPDSVTLDRGSPREPRLTSRIFSLAFSAGKSGNISVLTGDYLATGGGFLFSGTAGTKPGAQIELLASRSVTLDGVQPQTLQPSLISSLTIGPSQAGKVEIETPRLVVKNGGRVDSSTAGAGDAGEVKITADSVEVTGFVEDSRNPSLITSSATILDERLREAIGVDVPVPSGDSGDVVINTQQLSVAKGAQVTVRNDGPGDAGTLIVDADSITLNNQGGITASTAGGKGGNINLQVAGLLLLQNTSKVTASARKFSSGGNILINTGVLAALNNSDISADAEDAFGGRVVIDSQGTFGTEFRDQLTQESDITATSDRGPQFSGTVVINAPDVDFAKATALPVTQPESPKVSSACQSRSDTEASSLTSPGAGGIPATPADPLTATRGWNDNASAAQESLPNAPQPVQQADNSDKFVEAQGWLRNPDGTLSMTTNVDQAVPYSSLSTPACQQGNQTRK